MASEVQDAVDFLEGPRDRWFEVTEAAVGTSISSKAVLCLLENFPALFTLDSALMEKFLLSMQEFFKESSILGGQSGTLSIYTFVTI